MKAMTEADRADVEQERQEREWSDAAHAYAKWAANEKNPSTKAALTSLAESMRLMAGPFPVRSRMVRARAE